MLLLAGIPDFSTNNQHYENAVKKICYLLRKVFSSFYLQLADKNETNVIVVICKICKEFQMMVPTLVPIFIVGVYFRSA